MENRLGWLRSDQVRLGYLVTTVILLSLYPFLSSTWQNVFFQLAALAAIAAVVAGFLVVNPGHKRFWLLLLLALVLIDVGNVMSIASRGTAVSVNGLVDGVGNVILLTAALILVARQGRNNLGGIVDATIVALAIGGILWELLLGPRLLPVYREGSAQIALCLVVIALCGILGALSQLVMRRSVAAMRPLIVAFALSFAGTVIVAVSDSRWQTTIAGMSFLAAYTAIGLFGLDPTAAHLFTPAPVRADKLSIGRLVFLGFAITIVPVLIGSQQSAGDAGNGLLLIVSSATIATLVMVRIGHLSAQRDRAEAALRHDATHDSLTGLVNRKEFVDQLDRALSRRERTTVVFCDLDRFKAVNDQFGHERGDALLIEVAQRLQDCVRANDVVSRFGGDEFVILLRDTTPSEVEAINRRIVDAISRPFLVGGADISIGVTIGAVRPDADTDPEKVISQADRAMYAEKGRRPQPSLPT